MSRTSRFTEWVESLSWPVRAFYDENLDANEQLQEQIDPSAFVSEETESHLPVKKHSDGPESISFGGFPPTIWL